MAATQFFQMTQITEGAGQQAVTVNTALETIDRALGGVYLRGVAGGTDVTLTATEWKYKFIEFNGALTANINVIVPTFSRVFVAYNNTSGAYTLTVKTASGSGVAVAQGTRQILVCDGTSVYGVSALGSFTTEDAQDAVGAMIDGSLVYVDGTPLLTRAALTGDVTASQGSNATTIANQAVTYAKIQDISATARILARVSSGAGSVEEATLSQILDFIGAAAQGDILYRGASGWSRLAAGTSGYALKTQGSSADPIWGIDASTIGRHTLYIPAVGMASPTTNGATPSQIEMTTNKNNLRTMSFPDAAVRYASFIFTFPKAWNNGTVTYRVHWTVNSTSTNGVVFGLQAVATSNGDALDVAYGTAQEVTDNGLGTAYVKHLSSESSAITIAGTPATGDSIDFRLYRDPTNGSDTMAASVEVLGIELFYTTQADTDV